MSIPLRRSGIVGGVVLGATALIAVTSGLAGAQEPPEESIGVTPSSGAPGTSITVTGTGCDGTEVALLLLNGDIVVDDATAAPDGEDGSWAGTLTVPGDAVDGAELGITADCFGGTVAYEDGFFLVVVVEPPTTSSTAPTTSTTLANPGAPTPPGDQPGPTATTQPAAPGGGSANPPAAPPATPVVAQPSFTG